MESHGERPAREVLRSHRPWSQEARQRNARMGATSRCHRQNFGSVIERRDVHAEKRGNGDRVSRGAARRVSHGKGVMCMLRSTVSGLRSLFQKKRVDGELDEELRSFFNTAAEVRMRDGLSQKEALRAVRLERGSLETAKAEVRSAGWVSFVETCWQDLRLATRML